VRALGPSPAEGQAPTYLNVFNNGETGKKWTKIGAAFTHKEGAGSASS
jgi:hypothetical protein